jgi:hypothetical protein
MANIILPAMVGHPASAHLQRVWPMHTVYRFLTRDDTLDPGEWVDSSPGQNEIRVFATRADFTAFTEQVEVEGWELVSAKQTPIPHGTDMITLETWTYRRSLND